MESILYLLPTTKPTTTLTPVKHNLLEAQKVLTFPRLHSPGDAMMTDSPERLNFEARPPKPPKKIGWTALNYLDLRYGKPAIIQTRYQQNPFQWLRKQQGEIAVKFVRTDLNDNFPF